MKFLANPIFLATGCCFQVTRSERNQTCLKTRAKRVKPSQNPASQAAELQNCRTAETVYGIFSSLHTPANPYLLCWSALITPSGEPLWRLVRRRPNRPQVTFAKSFPNPLHHPTPSHPQLKLRDPPPSSGSFRVAVPSWREEAGSSPTSLHQNSLPPRGAHPNPPACPY